MSYILDNIKNNRNSLSIISTVQLIDILFILTWIDSYDDKTIEIQRRIETREDGKSGTLTSVTKDNLVVSPTKIRKLTPVECERLQCLPDNYTQGISNTQRYRSLGNGFNVEVIKFILSFLAV